MTLREKIGREISDALVAGCTDRADFPERLADLIITIPEIKEALEAKQKADRIKEAYAMLYRDFAISFCARLT